MAEIRIIEEKKDAREEGKIEETKVAKILEIAEEARKMKEANDLLEKELIRKNEIMERMKMGGKSYAGKIEPTEKEQTDMEAKKILRMFS